MLGKLMKHEFRATARLILPLYLVVVALAAFTRVTNWILEKNDNGILSLINGLFIFLFVVSLFASVIFAVVMPVAWSSFLDTPKNGQMPRNLTST